MNLKKTFINDNNLEFIITTWSSDISKVLYRSFWDSQDFKRVVLNFLLKESNVSKNQKDILCQIFDIDYTYNQLFHFWDDPITQRYKFYISLYNTDFKSSLRLISQIKTILWITDKYYLEKDFHKFDCLGFDIQNGKISLKIYEIISWEKYIGFLPRWVNKKNISETWVLKDFNGRKKLFFRFSWWIPINNFSEEFDINMYEKFEKDLDGIYVLQKKVKYYCIEGDKKELYFI